MHLNSFKKSKRKWDITMYNMQKLRNEPKNYNNSSTNLQKPKPKIYSDDVEMILSKTNVITPELATYPNMNTENTPFKPYKIKEISYFPILEKRNVPNPEITLLAEKNDDSYNDDLHYKDKRYINFMNAKEHDIHPYKYTCNF